MSSLGRDVGEIAASVDYVRSYKAAQHGTEQPQTKVVLFGHSTGSQDVLYYLSAPNPLQTDPRFDPLRSVTHNVRPQIDGAILQAPVSDREGLQLYLRSHDGPEASNLYTSTVSDAKGNTFTNDGEDVLLPIATTRRLGYGNDVAVSKRRFWSLANPDGPVRRGEDDMFSSDLPNSNFERTFGMVDERGLLRENGRLCVLVSGADEYMPDRVDKAGLIAKWHLATSFRFTVGKTWDKQWSGVVEGASHALGGNGQTASRAELVRRVMGFLQGLEGA